MTQDEILGNQKDAEVTKTVYDCIFHMYEMEWQITHDIENKATSIVGFIGLIFSLTIGSLSTIIACANEVTREAIFSSRIYFSFLILILVLMLSSIFCGILAINVKGWKFLIAPDFLELCETIKEKNELNVERLHTEMIDNIKNLIVANTDKNKEIAKYLKYTYYLFFASIVLFVIYFIHIVNIST